MNKKFNTMIYPFDVDSISLIRHNDLIENLNFIHAVSPSGWGLTGEDVSCVDYSEPLGIIVEDDFDNALKDCDTVMFVKSNIELDFTKFIYSKMLKAAESSKNIICNIQLEEDTKKLIAEVCTKNNKLFKYMFDEEIERPFKEEIFKVDTPVIFVAGLGDKTNKFEVQINIRKELIQMGYKVSQIGTRNYCELMGFHSFPKFMYEKKFYEWEKVVLLNYYIKKIEAVEKPDVIVIGIPGSTLPLDNVFTNKFGILPYEISQAVKPDVTVLCTLYQQEFIENYLRDISNTHKNKFGYSIDCYNISNARYNKVFSELLGRMQYTILDWKLVSKKIREAGEFNMPLFNILDKNDGEKLTELLVDKLASYAE